MKHLLNYLQFEFTLINSNDILSIVLNININFDILSLICNYKSLVIYHVYLSFYFLFNLCFSKSSFNIFNINFYCGPWAIKKTPYWCYFKVFLIFKFLVFILNFTCYELIKNLLLFLWLIVSWYATNTHNWLFIKCNRICILFRVINFRR